MYPLLDKLKYCQDKGITVSLFSDLEDPERFTVGRIRGLSENWTLVDCIDEAGAYAGLCGVRTELIYSLIYGDRYTETVGAAFIGEGAVLSACPDEEPLTTALCYARDRRLLVDCEYSNSGSWDISGYVEAVEGSLVSLSPLNETGEVDGHCFLDSTVLTRVQVYPGGGRKDASKLILLRGRER